MGSRSLTTELGYGVAQSSLPPVDRSASSGRTLAGWDSPDHRSRTRPDRSLPPVRSRSPTAQTQCSIHPATKRSPRRYRRHSSPVIPPHRLPARPRVSFGYLHHRCRCEGDPISRGTPPGGHRDLPQAKIIVSRGWERLALHTRLPRWIPRLVEFVG